jgi:hypothetical protein
MLSFINSGLGIYSFRFGISFGSVSNANPDFPVWLKTLINLLKSGEI